jgi:hypothetical protein
MTSETRTAEGRQKDNRYDPSHPQHREVCAAGIRCNACREPEVPTSATKFTWKVGTTRDKGKRVPYIQFCEDGRCVSTSTPREWPAFVPVLIDTLDIEEGK